ncbi:flagellar transcriptional regulator FlhD [Salinicola tamaricis]|uniref:flagellar transcriptional regulator FlhD n=1 Tax=Salinicola tamaricis TaxID=1771309 RepID=UPI000D0A55E5|nr:flagellar transcriptional regulator FlhD [Salinicola tamaricis]
MHKNGYLEDIQDLNLSYLLLVQRLLNEDRETAMFRLNLDAEMADAIAGLSIKQLTNSRAPISCCAICASPMRVSSICCSTIRCPGLSQTHAALLMAGANRIALPSSQEG